MPLRQDEIHAMLESMIIEFRKENRADHREMRAAMSELQDDVVKVKLWRARIMGMAAAVATMVSAGGWAIAHALGG